VLLLDWLVEAAAAELVEEDATELFAELLEEGDEVDEAGGGLVLDVVCAAACVVVGVGEGAGAAEVVGAGATYVEVVGAGEDPPLSPQFQDMLNRPTPVFAKNSNSP
jgi:hypothetical protein